jgi:hypothetical protein
MTNTTGRHRTTNVIITKHIEKSKTNLVPLTTHVLVGPTVGPAYGPTRQNQWPRSYADVALHVSMTPPLWSHCHVEIWAHKLFFENSERAHGLLVPLFRLAGHQHISIGPAYFAFQKQWAIIPVALGQLLCSREVACNYLAKKFAFPRIRTRDERIAERKSCHCTIKRIALENYIFT